MPHGSAVSHRRTIHNRRRSSLRHNAADPNNTTAFRASTVTTTSSALKPPSPCRREAAAHSSSFIASSSSGHHLLPRELLGSQPQTKAAHHIFSTTSTYKKRNHNRATHAHGQSIFFAPPTPKRDLHEHYYTTILADHLHNPTNHKHIRLFLPNHYHLFRSHNNCKSRFRHGRHQRASSSLQDLRHVQTSVVVAQQPPQPPSSSSQRLHQQRKAISLAQPALRKCLHDSQCRGGEEAKLRRENRRWRKSIPPICRTLILGGKEADTWKHLIGRVSSLVKAGQQGFWCNFGEF
ncbi:hypothetical protein LR48_Vigan03g145300 [Vigna angularis]|uniref:Uncharacterized protein n=1 Tax=Phaseolus angularis TaxID=3914 RepID=A0A0L9U5M2_PHAAN|nr:hypothetical protein LR48_Vigan03g145300 [Vigna angularis]